MSEIFVDTIRKTGGSLGTDIRIKNTSVYESDGGTSVTQNIVQGLTKHFTQFTQASASVQDSFNQSSATDEGTGDTSWDFTNAMGNDDYCSNLNCNSSSFHFVQSFNDAAKTTAGDRCYTMEADGAASNTDGSTIFVSTVGDLA